MDNRNFLGWFQSSTLPLSEFYRMGKGKMDASQPKTTGVSYVPDNEFVELVWEDGQVMMQGQSKDKKTPVSSNFQFLTQRVRENRDIGVATATTSKMGKFGAMESSLNLPISVPTVDLGLNQDDDMVPWLNYPIEDPLEQDYCSNLLPEISGVTLNEPSNHHNFAMMDKRGSCNQTVRESQNVSVHYGSTVDQGNSSKASSLRVSHVFPWTSHQGPTMPSSLVSGVSDIISGNTRNNPPVTCGDPRQVQSSSGGVSQMKLQKQDSGLPCSSSNLLNFSHFSGPINMARADNQNVGLLANCGTSGIERMGNNNKQSVPNNNVPAELKLNAPNGGLQKEIGFHSQSNLVPANFNSRPLVTKQLEKSRSGDQSDTCRREDDKPPSLALGSMTAKDLPNSEKHTEPILATSSVCSGNSAERASNDPSNNLKRKRRDTEDFECQSEDADEESVGVKKAASCRGGTGSKRSRAAEVHNLSERRRRDRINEKMRALQELIPNCNKVDKASMLDEAIEYLKTLQLQVQIMSMGAGLCMPPMMFTAGMQHMHPAHFSHMGVGMGMGMRLGMGFGMGMVDMNGGSLGRPMIPMQGQRYPAPPIPSHSNLQGIPPGSNLPIFGHPGQGIPMPFPQGGTASMLGRPPMSSSAAGLNAPRAGPHVEVGNVASNLNSKDSTQNTSTQPMHNADTNNSMNQPSSQFQAKNEGLDQPAFAGKNDQAAADVGGSTAVLTNSNDSIPSR